MDQTPEEWLADLFEFEFCDECGGDAAEHDVCLVPGIGNYFARCRLSFDEPGATEHVGRTDGTEGPNPPPAVEWRDTAGGGVENPPLSRTQRPPGVNPA